MVIIECIGENYFNYFLRLCYYCGILDDYALWPGRFQAMFTVLMSFSLYSCAYKCISHKLHLYLESLRLFKFQVGLWTDCNSQLMKLELITLMLTNAVAPKQMSHFSKKITPFQKPMGRDAKYIQWFVGVTELFVQKQLWKVLFKI